MTRRPVPALTAAMLAVFLCAALAGCGNGGDKTPAGKTEAGQATRPSSTTTSGGGRAVLITGRSVAYNWMAYWGYVGSGSVKKNGYVFRYKELDGENIPSSFASAARGLAPGSVVFFKFCFVDFDGSNLKRREKELEEVIATARSRGLRLVIGNALPVRRQDGNQQVVAEEKAFNEFAAQQASGNPGVWVLDLNGILAGEDGFLKAEYQTGDSHPNNKAYSVIDQAFFPMLESVFSGAVP